MLFFLEVSLRRPSTWPVWVWGQCGSVRSSSHPWRTSAMTSPTTLLLTPSLAPWLTSRRWFGSYTHAVSSISARAHISIHAPIQPVLHNLTTFTLSGYFSLITPQYTRNPQIHHMTLSHHQKASIIIKNLINYTIHNTQVWKLCLISSQTTPVTSMSGSRDLWGERNHIQTTMCGLMPRE